MRLMLAALLVGVSMAAEQAFDVASVKISPPDAPRPYTISGGPGTRDVSRFRARHTTMEYLLQRAYGVQRDQIAGPSWIKEAPASVNYEIAVTMSPETTQEQFQKMLQVLLAERFHLIVHHETRHFPGYALVIDKGGPKLTEVKIDDDIPDERPPGRQPHGPDGFIMMVGPAYISMLNDPVNPRVKFQQRTLADFAGRLGPLVATSQGLHPGQGDPVPRVIDMSGLTGIYTFTIEYSCPPCDTRVDSAGDPGSGKPELFQAIQKQLGLRLEKKPDVSLDVIVVDSIDKTPTAN